MRLEKDPTRVREFAHRKSDENWRYRLSLKNTPLSPEQIDTILATRERRDAGPTAPPGGLTL